MAPHEPTPTGLAGPAADVRPDFLVRLGLMLPCSPQDAKEAYLSKAKQLHPDKGGDAALFVELQTDYERAVHYCQFHSSRSRWLADGVERYVEQQQIITEVEQRGGRVTLERLDWLKNEVGEDFAQVLDTIAGIRFTGPSASDADIDYLLTKRHALDTLHWLDFSRSQITNRGLAKLALFPKLRKIDLRGTPIGNSGIRVVKELPELEWLGLSGSGVNWLGRFRLRRWLPAVQIG